MATDLPDRPWPFVGREETVRRIVSSVANSPASAVVLSGASGIGKSRAAVEAVSRLADAGWAVLRVQGTAGLAHAPLAALSPLFTGERTDLEAAPADPLALLADAGARLTALASGKRTVIFVDDITWVDALSLGVLVQLLQARAVKVVATARSGEPLPDAVVSLWTGDAATRIDLPALTFDEVTELLRAYLGQQVAMHALTSLLEASGGNPLYLRELVIGALGDGRLVLREGSWQLVGDLAGTPALRELIEARLRGLDPVARDVLERVALCEQLLVDELTGDGARQALTALEAGGLLIVSDSPRGLLVGLSHPQYAAALRAGIPRLRAVDLLLEQSALVTARGGGDLPPEDAVRVATWNLDAGRPSNPELLLTGARLNRVGHELADALRLAEAAVVAGAGDSSTQFLIGELLRALGRTDEALAALERARDLAIRDGDVGARIAAVALHALCLADKPKGSPAGLRELDELVADVPAAASAVVAVRAGLLMNEERAADAVAVLADLAEPTIEADIVGCVPLAVVGRASDADAASLRVLDYVATTPVQVATIPRRMACFLRATTLLMIGRPIEATTVAMEALREAVASEDAVATRQAEFTLGHAFLEAGLLRTGARWFRDAASGALTHGPISYRWPALGALAQLQLWRGLIDEARATIAEIPPETRESDVSGVSAMAWLTALDGDPARGRRMLTDKAVIFRENGHAFLESWMLFNAARLGGALENAERLRQIADAGDSLLYRSRAVHAEALRDGSVSALETAAISWREQGYPFYAAETFAAASRAASADGDARRASQLARDAAEQAEKAQGADVPALRTTAGAEVLTPREREIAQLAASGASSQAIADRLFLSIRTVDNHLQAAYRKLGIAGRAELESAL